MDNTPKSMDATKLNNTSFHVIDEPMDPTNSCTINIKRDSLAMFINVYSVQFLVILFQLNKISL